MPLGTYQRIERTGRGHITNLRAIAKVLGVTIDALFTAEPARRRKRKAS